MSHIKTDSPIQNKTADTLGRASFAEKIGKAIAQYNGLDSLVIGIYGKWGNGKTSVINMVLEAVVAEDVNEESSPIIIHFRPWHFSGQDHLLEQFFKQLAYEIQGTLANVGGKVADAGKRIGGLLLIFGSFLEPTNKIADSMPILR